MKVCVCAWSCFGIQSIFIHRKLLNISTLVQTKTASLFRLFQITLKNTIEWLNVMQSKIVNLIITIDDHWCRWRIYHSSVQYSHNVDNMCLKHVVCLTVLFIYVHIDSKVGYTQMYFVNMIVYYLFYIEISKGYSHKVNSFCQTRSIIQLNWNTKILIHVVYKSN